ncbi:MAG: phasin family protein [Parvibaculaceae bacterium]
MTTKFEDWQGFGKEGVEAYVASATAVTKGFQAMAAEAADYSRKSFEKGAQTVEKVLAAKSIDKVFEIQQGYAKEAYEAYLGEVNKLGELYLAAAKEAYKPFESKFAAFTPKVGK